MITGAGVGADHDAVLAVAARPRRSRALTVGASTVGNVVEWFDFSIYAYYATYIGRTFFPSDSQYGSVLSAFAVFGVGFAARPLGSIVFGHFGDKVGRRNVLSVAILLMAFCSALIGVLPGYATAGTVGSVCLVLARLLQGFSTGGEFAGAGLFLVEHAPPNRRGTIGSFHQAGVGIGLFLGSLSATLLSNVLPQEAIAAYGWRIPFLLGGVFGLVGLVLRLGVEESPFFEAAKAEGDLSRAPLVEAVREHRGLLFRVGGIFVSATVNFYGFLAYLPVFATVVLHMPPRESFLANTIGAAVFAGTSLLAGRISDRRGRKPVLLVHAGGVVLLAIPMFLLLDAHRTFLVLLAVQCTGAALQGLFSGAGLITALELMPTRLRYSALGVPQSIVTTLFGGMAPFFVTSAVALTGSPIAIAYYLVAGSMISLLTYLSTPETLHNDLARR